MPTTLRIYQERIIADLTRNGSPRENRFKIKGRLKTHRGFESHPFLRPSSEVIQMQRNPRSIYNLLGAAVDSDRG
jgi:hypothetical protein